jgi:8-oxo-dGTP diphosphatase
MTTHVHLIRHAKAKSRTEWTEPDDRRPLTKAGARRGRLLAQRLEADAPGRLVSSPFLRCTQTLEPLALTLDLPIETTELLAEGADGSAALDLMTMLARAESIACCTHGDVLYDRDARAHGERSSPRGPARRPRREHLGTRYRRRPRRRWRVPRQPPR